MNRIVVALEPLYVPDTLLDWIERLSTDLGVAVDVVHLVPRTTLWPSGAQADINEYLQRLRSHFEHHVLARLRSRGIAARLHVIRGDPADEVANFARRVNADLIVVGGADHSALADRSCAMRHRRRDRSLLGRRRCRYHPSMPAGFCGPMN